MKIISTEQVSAIELYVTDLYTQFTVPSLVYHNLDHTIKVVKRSSEIAKRLNLNTENRFIVTAACWFHDCGHLFGKSIGHEMKSIQILRNYFIIHFGEFDMRLVEQIEECIKATMLPNNPTSLLGEIVCDADSYHLGTEEFVSTNELVKNEFELRNSKTFTDIEWNTNTLKLLNSHLYFTSYCKDLLEEGKRENIELLKQLINNESHNEIIKNVSPS